MRNVLTILFLSLLIAGTGCNIVNPKENIPTYVRIDSFSFATKDYVKEGTASQKITSAWIYFNNQSLGTYELPATIPVITDGPGELHVIPGVAYHGLSYEAQYPFFTGATTTLGLSPGNVTRFTPQVSYVESAKFQWKENFELGTSSFQEVNSEKAEDTSIMIVTDNRVFEGSASGYIHLDAAHPTSESIVKDGIPIPQGKAFLEVNYRSTTSFVIGVQTLVSGEIIYKYIGGVRPRENWNKIYFDLSAFTGENQGKEYRIMIKATLDEGLSEGWVLLDNFKVVSF